MSETLTPGAEVAEQDVVAQASEIVEKGKQDIRSFLSDGRYNIIDSRTNLVIDTKGKTTLELMEELRELREADVD